MEVKTRKGTCDGCGKVRKLTLPAAPPRAVSRDRWRMTREQRDAEDATQIQFYWLCSECFPQVETTADIARLRKERGPRKPASKFAYPIVGGPLDGEYACTFDFHGGGIYAAHDREYVEYNGAGRGRKVIGGFPPSMIYVHQSLLKPLQSTRAR